MREREEIIDLINSHHEMFEGAFLERKASDEEIQEAEKRLEFKIPEEYVWFLKEFGHGGCMFEFMGFGLTGRAIFVEETLEQRKYDLPDNLLVFQNCDEFFDCINVDDGSVVTWSSYDNAGIVEVADNFLQYFYETIREAIDNY